MAQDVFLEETLSQPSILRGAVGHYLADEELLGRAAEALARRKPDLILLTGMGTSFFALYPACIYLNAHALPAVMLETSELLHYYPDLVSPRTLLLVVSQSGESAEVRKLLDLVRGRTTIVGLTNEPESYLAANCDVTLPMLAGRELGPATKTYTASIALLLLLARRLAGAVDGGLAESLSEAAEAMAAFLGGWQEPVRELAAFLDGLEMVSLIGRGPSLGSAWAGALILKEAAKVNAEALSAGQFRHGPLQAASERVGAIVFSLRGRTADLNLGLARDIARFGGKVVAMGGQTGNGEGMLSLTLPALDELAAPIVEIVPLQLLAWQIARDRGLASGRFDQATKVTLVE